MAQSHPGESLAAALASLNYLLSSHAWQQDHNAADLLRIHLPALKVRVVNGVTTDPGG